MTNIERLKLEEECLSKYSKEEIIQQYIDELEDNIKLTEYAKDLYDRIDKAIEYNRKVLTWTTNEEITDEIANENLKILKGE